MKRLNLFYSFSVICILVFGTSLSGYSQTNSDSHQINLSIPQLTLLEIYPNGVGSTDIDMELQNPINIGGQFNNAPANSSLWLHFSALVGATNYRVYASIDFTVPDGTELKVSASDKTSGGGSIGSATGQITLTGTPTPLISGIGSCWTGAGDNEGYQLIYNWDITSYDQLDPASTISGHVIYTITDI